MRRNGIITTINVTFCWFAHGLGALYFFPSDSSEMTEEISLQKLGPKPPPGSPDSRASAHVKRKSRFFKFFDPCLEGIAHKSAHAWAAAGDLAMAVFIDELSRRDSSGVIEDAWIMAEWVGARLGVFPF